MSEIKKIVLLCSRLDTPGGIERAVVNTAGLLTEYGHTVSIIVADTEGINKSYYPAHSSINLSWIKADFGIGGHGNSISRKIRLIKDIRKMGMAIRQHSPDIVISSEYHLTAAMVLSGGAGNAQKFSWEHHPFGHIKTSRFWSVLKQYSYKKLNGIVCLNEKEAALYRSQGHVHIIPNFIRVAAEKSDRSAVHQLLTVGWLTELKGIDRLPVIARSILKKHPDWTWMIIGDGPQKPVLQAFIKEEKLESQLLLVGSAEADLERVYRESGFLVLLSRTEAFPMVILEAMATGLPCISFDCPTGPGTIIQNEKDGLLVEDGNSEKMILAIDRFISDSDLRVQYGIAAVKNIQRFSSEAVIKKWNRIFSDLPGDR